MVFGNNKMLGVLIRGTDYLKSDYHMATRKMVGPKEMITIIEEWMDKYSFDKIFLATEDKDILDQMRSHFSSKIIAVSQERYSVNDFDKNETIAEKEKTISDSDTYSNILEDATSNYFYALYLLSECDSFICSRPW